MADAQLGNGIGVAAVDAGPTGRIAAITADGANTFTVSAADARKMQAGMAIDLVNKTDGTVLASGRTISSIDLVTGIVTYSGGDLTTVPGTTEVYVVGGYKAASTANPATDKYNNINGGFSVQSGFELDSTDTIKTMRERLTAINSTTYSAGQLDKMTYNDLVYAIRLNDAAGSIK